MGLWGYGTMGPWGYGAMGPWGYGAMGPWGYGTMGLWGYEGATTGENLIHRLIASRRLVTA